MRRESEAYMPPELVQRVLARASLDVMLIGGQALAYWMGFTSLWQQHLCVQLVVRLASDRGQRPIGSWVSQTRHVHKTRNPERDS